MSTISAVLLKAGIGVEPEPIVIGDLESIQRLVGGHIDAVRIDAQEVDSENEPFTLVGYCHDEGLILDLEMNWLASALFQRELRGDVVLVSGHSSTGEYDGENYDVPDTMVSWLRSTFVKRVAETYNEATALTAAFQYAIENNLIEPELFHEAMQAVAEDVENGERSEMVADKLRNLINITGDAIVGHTANKVSGKLVSEVEEFLRKETEK